MRPIFHAGQAVGAVLLAHVSRPRVHRSRRGWSPAQPQVCSARVLGAVSPGAGTSEVLLDIMPAARAHEVRGVRQGQPETLAQQITNRCRHFNGAQNERCRAEISYLALVDGVQDGLGLRIPCYRAGRLRDMAIERGIEPVACPSASYPTPAEAEQEATAIMARLCARADLHASGTCPDCSRPCLPTRVVGSCIYSACGCRIGLARASRRRR